MLMRLAGLDLRFVRGEGVWLWSEAGRRYLDGYAQYGALALGHNHPAVKAAIIAALDSSVPAMVQPYAATHAEALAREMYALGGNHFSRCVFTTSGAETVEAAIKLVRMRSGRPLILSAEGSYHGKTMGALAASDRLDFSAQHQQAVNGFARVAYGDVAALAEFLQERGHECAGFIVEPLQGERGVFAPPRGYLKAAGELCAQHGVAFIADEIQTGLFRTGRAFACDLDEVVPDVLLLAKALGGGVFPLGACLVNEQTWDAGFALTHSSTFANNNLACAAGLAVLREMQQASFQENLAAAAAMLGHGLADLARRFPLSVKEVRGRGMMHAIELRAPAADAGYFLNYLHGQGLSAFMFAAVLAKNHDVLVLPVLNDSQVVRIAPALVASPQNIADLLDGLAQVLAIWESAASAQIVRAVMRPHDTGAPAAKPQPKTMPRYDVSREPPIRFPPQRASRESIDYAFIIHPTTVDDILLNDPTFKQLSAQEFHHYREYSAQLPAGVVCEIPQIVAPNGARARGVLIGLPLLPGQMLARGRNEICGAIAAAVDLAHARGAKVVGLGAYTSIYTRKGSAVTQRGPAITTGNLLTAGMTFEALQWMLNDRGIRMSECRVGVVGARGSVGALVSQLVARASPKELILAGNPHSDVSSMEGVAERLRSLGAAQLRTCNDIAMLEHCDVIVSASSSAGTVLDGVSVHAGTIICDVARPYDASATMRARGDITVIDAGLVSLPGIPRRIGIGNLQGHPPGIALACLSETILLGLAGAAQDHGIGDDVTLAEVDRMMKLAELHGFSLARHGLAHDSGNTAADIAASRSSYSRAAAA